MWWKIFGALLAAIVAGWTLLQVLNIVDRASDKNAFYWDKAATDYMRAFKNSEEIISLVEAEWKGPVAPEHTQPIKTVIANVEKLLKTVPGRATQRAPLEAELANAKRILAEAEARQ